MSIIDFDTRRQARENARAAEGAAKAAAKAAEQEELEQAREEAKRKLRAYVANVFLKRHDLHYVSATDCFWERYAGDRWLPLRERACRMLDWSRMRSDDYFALFMEVMREEGRIFRNITSSFADVPPDTLNTLSADFCPAVEGEPHAVFEALVGNLANGDAEAQAHIERLVLSKWRKPAAMLPALCFHDPEGGSGKSLFASTVLPAVFGRALVADNLSMEDVTGRFNAHLSGRAVWFINESVADKVDDNALKRVLGSPTIWIENKGVPRYEVENTAWVVVAGNSPMGSVRVSNSGVDRRYSIIRTGGALVDRLVGELKHADREAARRWIAAEGVRLLSDPVEVGRWLRALAERHGEVEQVEAFHGRDYAEMVEDQKPFHEQVFAAVFRATGFAYIRKPVLYQLYADLCRSMNGGYGLLRNRGLYAHLRVWAEREGIALAERKAKWQPAGFGEKQTTADVIHLGGAEATSGVLRDNDASFGTCEFGRWTWKVSV